MDEKQETERVDYIMPYLQDLVQHENEREVEWVKSEERSSRLDIEYMTINMPFIGIQARKD